MKFFNKAGYYFFAGLGELLTMFAAGVVWVADQSKRLARKMEEDHL